MKAFFYLLASICLLGQISLALSSELYGTANLTLATFLITAIALLKPNAALAFFLFALPIFGNKPGTFQAQSLMALSLAITFALSLKVALADKKSEKLISGLQPALFYLIVSILSLIPISLGVFLKWFRSSQTHLLDLNLLSWNFSSILLAREDEPFYPLLSVFWTILAFALSYFVYFFARHSPSTRSLFCWSLFGGFLCSLVVGLLNYYGILNLDWLRGLDPVVNPGGTQYRLQSWFGHSGWYAEYITLLAPFCMLVLLLPISYWGRISILLFLLLIGELVLILTFQRGGWLSYPLSLLAIWASVYVVRKLELGEKSVFTALRSSAIKIVISLPLTLLASFLILNLFGSQFGLDQYASRFRDITKTSDRSEFVRAGFALGSLNPILGQGSESFAIQYRREYKSEDGAFFGQIDLPLHGTAHNFYAQTFAGKGTLGILSLLLMMFVAIKSAFNFVLSSGPNQTRGDQIIALSAACSLIACFIYGFVQEIFYVQTLQFVFFAMLGLIASLANPLPNINKFKVLSILTVLFVCHLLFALKSGRSYSDAGGCFAKEQDPSGQSWQWCGVRSSLDIPSSTKTMTLETAPSRNKNLVQVKICDQVIFSELLQGGQKVKVELPATLPECAFVRPDILRVHAYSAEYFIAAQANPESQDRRVLAIRWLY